MANFMLYENSIKQFSRHLWGENKLFNNSAGTTIYIHMWNVLNPFLTF